MKYIVKILFLITVGISTLYSSSLNQKYTIIVCSVKSIENANTFISKNIKINRKIFIIKNNNRYLVAYGSFDSVNDASVFIETLDFSIKVLKPYVKRLSLPKVKKTLIPRMVNYAITVANCSTLKNTEVFIKKYIKYPKAKINVYKLNNKFIVTYGEFKTKKESLAFRNNLSEELRVQKPYPIIVNNKHFNMHNKIKEINVPVKITKKVKKLKKLNQIKKIENNKSNIPTKDEESSGEIFLLSENKIKQNFIKVKKIKPKVKPNIKYKTKSKTKSTVKTKKKSSGKIAKDNNSTRDNYQSLSFEISKQNFDLAGKTSKVNSSSQTNLLLYKLHKPNYIVSAGYQFTPNQVVFSDLDEGNSYDKMIESKQYSLSYLHKLYLNNDIYYGPKIKLSKYQSTSTKYLTSPNTVWSNFGLNDIIYKNYTDFDLSLDVVIAKQYASYSNVYANLNLINDLAFNCYNEDDENNYLFTLGVEHYLENDFILKASYSKYLTNKETLKWYETGNLSNFMLGIGYKF